MVCSQVFLALPCLLWGVDQTNSGTIRVADGILQPRCPMAQAVAQPMEFLRKGDGDYRLGRIDDPLASYFSTAVVNPDRNCSERQLAFAALSSI